jgi:hypothetical protein
MPTLPELFREAAAPWLNQIAAETLAFRCSAVSN